MLRNDISQYTSNTPTDIRPNHCPQLHLVESLLADHSNLNIYLLLPKTYLPIQETPPHESILQIGMQITTTKGNHPH